MQEKDVVNGNWLRREMYDSNFRAPLGDRLSRGRVPDIVCLSHLRWDFVFQRPQHLLSRFARDRRVYFVEEPIFRAGAEPRLDTSRREGGLVVVVPVLPEGMSAEAQIAAQRLLLDGLVADRGLENAVLWYYTPMALPFSRHLSATAVVYDCMDELSLFKNAPPALRLLEAELFRRADLVFTGGQSLYEAKRRQYPQHPSLHPFPSGVDAAHFRRGRLASRQPADQRGLPSPRAGFFGVIDERLDIELLGAVAARLPQWQFVMVGPVVKIDRADLPTAPNIHYLGQKNYAELPAYLSGWDVAMMPFARNEATRFISPTKTPEYLAAGRPVVSTSIRDVVQPYGAMGLAHIADEPAAFARAIESARQENGAADWLERVDTFLEGASWDSTWSRMDALVHRVTMRSASALDESPGRTSVAHGFA